jgi:putative glutathione S-transferase
MAARTAVADTAPDGAFTRQPAAYRDRISADGPFPPAGTRSNAATRATGATRNNEASADAAVCVRAAGRYVLYVSLACPWANRTLVALRMKGLEEAVAFGRLLALDRTSTAAGSSARRTTRP